MKNEINLKIKIQDICIYEKVNIVIYGRTNWKVKLYLEV